MVVFNRTVLGTVDTSIPLARTGLDPVVSDIEYLGSLVKEDSSSADSSFDRIKRAFDIVFAGVAIVLLSPVIFIAGILIRLESPGSIFFKQERIGLNRRRDDRRSGAGSGYDGPDRRTSNDRRKKIHAGKPFNIYKLRTMGMDAEKEGPALSCKGDSRITRIGHLLRRTRIDELPQFINVLRGDMSIVGPRPERSFYINQVRSDLPEFPLRLNVKPGITGPWAVGHKHTLDEEMRLTMFYIRNWTIWLDLQILFQTALRVLRLERAKARLPEQ